MSFLSNSLLREFDRWAGPALAVVGLGLLLLETRRPLRRRTLPRLGLDKGRWPRNILLAGPALPAMRLTLLPAMVGLTAAGAPRWHLLGRLPAPPRLLAEVLLLDYLGYSWHRLLHSPLLWCLHRVHHLDHDMDLTTAWRFHFGEMLASIPYRAGIPALLGVRPATVLGYEAVFEACTAFHHSNWELPFGLEKELVKLMVTPRAHGIHHSVVERETQSNYGVVLTLWDRLHRTLRLNVPQQALTMGVPAYPATEHRHALSLALLPLEPLDEWQRPDGTVPAREELPGPLTELVA